MPRRSASSLAVVPMPVRNARLPPPASLTRKVAEVWRAVVGSVPASHFALGDAVLIERYCAATVRAHTAEAALRRRGHVITSKRTGCPVLSPWVSVLAQAERTIATCARALRLTVQSRRDPKTAGRAISRATMSAYDSMPEVESE